MVLRHRVLGFLSAFLCVFCVLCGSKALRFARRVHGLSSSRHRNRLLAMTALTSPHSHHSPHRRSEEHTSELQSLMRISYAVFCLKKKKQQYNLHLSCNINHNIE